jgi:hypothetical protein
MLPRSALVGCLLVAVACGGRTRASSTELLPPATAVGPARCEVVQQLAQAPVPDTLRWAHAFAITEADGDAVFVHVKTPDVVIGHGRVTAGQPDFELQPGAATGQRPARFIGYEQGRGDGLHRFQVRDLHDPTFVHAVNEPSKLVSFPYMSEGPGGWGLIWSMGQRRPLHETLMFAGFDAARRVQAPHPLVSGRLEYDMDFVGTPSGYAIAYVEELGRTNRRPLHVLLLDPSGQVQQRVELAEGTSWRPRIAITSRGLTVVYSERSKLVAVGLVFAGEVNSPARDLGVSGHVGDLVVHRDDPWFAVQRSYCDGCSRGGWSCTAPPEAAAFHLARDGVVSEFELVHGGDRVWQEVAAAGGSYESVDLDADIGDVVLGSVGGRLLVAYTMTRKKRETPILHVAELSCPGSPSQ